MFTIITAWLNSFIKLRSFIVGRVATNADAFGLSLYTATMDCR